MKSLDSEEYIKVKMARLMIIGVFCSLFLVIFGAILYLVEYGGNKVDVSNFNYKMDKFSVLFYKILHLDPLAIIQLGVFVLVFLQLFRILLVLVYFNKVHDKLFMFLTIFVSVFLLYSWYNV